MIYQMALILMQTFKITLNLSLKNTKLWQKIHQFKFIQIKSKTELFLKHNGIQSWIVNSWNNEIIKKHKSDVGKDKGAEKVPNFNLVEVVLVYCNLVENDYQHTSKVLFTFLRNKQFGQLINISPHSLTMMNTVNTEFSSVELWFSTKVKHLKLKIMSIWQ